MSKIVDGARDFLKNTYPQRRSFFDGLSEGQSPHALFITCSDSRIDPNLVTGTQPGELFVIRNAGNLVGKQGSTDAAVAGTIEYAVKVLEVPEIIVCGHSNCGAMNGLADPGIGEQLPYVADMLKGAIELRSKIDKQDENWLDRLIEENVKLQLKNLMSFSFVKEAVQAGKTKLTGWVYQFQGDIHVLKDDGSEFQSIST